MGVGISPVKLGADTRVTTIWYVRVAIPSSAVTRIAMVFSPSTSVVLPSPVVVALLSVVVAVTVMLVTLEITDAV